MRHLPSFSSGLEKEKELQILLRSLSLIDQPSREVLHT
jgi:hypothetical protein